MFQNKKQLQYLWIFKPELNDIAKRKEVALKELNKKFDKFNQEKIKIIELVTGKTNLDTLLDKLGELAIRNNIEFESIVL